MILVVTGFFVLTGWLLPWILVKIITWPSPPALVRNYTLQGWILPLRLQVAGIAGRMVSDEFRSGDSLLQKMTDPKVLNNLKPSIEAHVDQFLQVKLKTVFPLLSQFMGEKTLSQFKQAFLEEIDLLLPIMIQQYVMGLRSGLSLDTMIAEKINAVPVDKLRGLILSSLKKEIAMLQLTGAAIGLFMGLICVAILFLLH